MKMKERNQQLKAAIGKIPDKKVTKEVMHMPEYDANNLQGFDAYAVPEKLHLLAMLNTLKLEPQFYRSESETMKELKQLVDTIAEKDAYFVAQAIVWSRCCGEGMRSINYLAAAFLAPWCAGKEWAKRFYGPFNKKTKSSGGVVYRLDDMSEIKDVFDALNNSVLTNAMKKGFRNVIEHASAYELCKYRKTAIDITNLVHPNTAVCAKLKDGSNVIDTLMKGKIISADTWENANSDAGQVVADAVKKGKLSEEKAKEVLKEAKNDNWKSLLKDGKLGILAAVRNLRNILLGDDIETVKLVSDLVSDGKRIKQGKIMPYQLEYAHTAVTELTEVSQSLKAPVVKALEKGMIEALPNLAEQLPGRNLVAFDISGSMEWSNCYHGKEGIHASALDKAAILAAMLAKGTNADIIRFNSRSEFFPYSANEDLFSLATRLKQNVGGGTSISSVFDLITRKHKKYDRIFIISDNEANHGCTRYACSNYIQNVCSPYIYAVDLAAYGTMPVRNDGKVNYYFGYGYSMLDDVASKEFNPNAVIDKVKAIKI